MVVKGNPPNGESFERGTWLFTLLRRRSGQMYNYILIHGLWSMASMVRDLEGT